MMHATEISMHVPLVSTITNAMVIVKDVKILDANMKKFMMQQSISLFAKIMKT
jgi:hypothetical protein